MSTLRAEPAATRCSPADGLPCRPHVARRFVTLARRSVPRELRRSAGTQARAPDPRERRHLQRLRRPARHGPALELDSVSAADPAEEWSGLEGLAQRARLLDALLADLYGPQRPSRRTAPGRTRLLGNSAFLRPCHGFRVRWAPAAPLRRRSRAQARTGSFWVLGDRTQSPSGAGYRRIQTARARARSRTSSSRARATTHR